MRTTWSLCWESLPRIMRWAGVRASKRAAHMTQVTHTGGARGGSISSVYVPVWLMRIPLHVRTLAAIALVALLLYLWPLAGLSTDYDEGVYGQWLRAMVHGQPLYTTVFSSQPPFFLLSLYPLYLLFGQTLVAARLAVALYALVGVIALYFAGRAIAGRWTGVFAAALL